MKEDEIIEYVNSMSSIDRLKIYMDYFVRMAKLKNDFIIIDLEQLHYGLGLPDKKFHNIGLYYLWKDFKIKTFEQFCDKSNIIIHNINVENRDFTSKNWTVFAVESIYHYIQIK